MVQMIAAGDFKSAMSWLVRKDSQQQQRRRSRSNSRRMSMGDMLSSGDFKGALRAIVSQDAPGAGEDEEPQDPEWFTSFSQFRPLEHRAHSSAYKETWFASAVHSGTHHVLKKHFKDKMPPAELRNLRRMLLLMEHLQHPNLVQVRGSWEDEETIYVVEEYIGRGDLLSDSMAHPARYTEKFTAQFIVEPLLRVLSYLHANSIIHRSVFLEHLLLGKHNQLHIGHFTQAINTRQDIANERIKFLDYMAPEMISLATLSDPNADRIMRFTPALDCGDDRKAPLGLQVHTGSPSPHREAGAPFARTTTSSERVHSGDFGGAGATRVAATGAVPEVSVLGKVRCEAVPELDDQCSAGGSAVLDESVFGKLRRMMAAHEDVGGLDEVSAGREASMLSKLRRGLTSDLEDAAARMGQAIRVASRTLVRPTGLVPGLAAQPEGRGRCAKQVDGSKIVVWNPWEWQDTYDAKVDVWQVGCVVHELLCGCLPFETDDSSLTAALTLWADVTEWPDGLSPECIDFLKACLTKDPRRRPSADALLRHPWIVRTCAGETLRTVAELREHGAPAPRGGLWQWLRDFFGSS
uniref:Protein kinase domain-containing protein n=1 Tax=Chlamydomonas euryale TaxID=1486919 RepID=A0A7R9YZK2_9CHLO